MEIKETAINAQAKIFSCLTMVLLSQVVQAIAKQLGGLRFSYSRWILIFSGSPPSEGIQGIVIAKHILETAT